jgi:3-oxoacyl-[acyl-carrier protein] reductase
MRQGRAVVITGATGGMGSVLVERFLDNGDTVVAADLERDALEALRAKLDAGPRLVVAEADIAEEADCGRLADVARGAAGRVDAPVNRAGHFPIRPFAEMPADEWRHVIGVNLTGAFLMTRAVLPLMSGRGWGRIVYIGSASVFEGAPGQAHYVAAKAGIIGLSRSLARECGDRGVTVNVVAPGLTLTPPVRDRFPGRGAGKGARRPRAEARRAGRRRRRRRVLPGLAGRGLHHRAARQRGRRQPRALTRPSRHGAGGASAIIEQEHQHENPRHRRYRQGRV